MTDKLLQDLQAALGPAYQIDRELTGGGMSRVFVASERALGRGVVIKVLPPELAAGINHERFRREIQLAAQLSHPYIVPLLHAGEAGELLWFTMPYIAGESLRARLTDQGPLPVDEVLRLLRDVVEALAYAHSRGVIHRDIKPANILSDGSHALITDFGVAKALGASLPLTGVAGHTTSGMAIGTPAYMAPEQLAADPSADHRVDLYAVGLVAYELLTGASPFAAPSPTAAMTAQLTIVPRSLSELRDDVPPALARLVDRLLAKLPEDRPADARAVLAELNRISGELVAVAHRSQDGVPDPARKASQLPLILSAAVVVALIALGVNLAGRSGNVPAALPETVMVASPGDSIVGALLPEQRPLTRDDSLAIAAALRDELERLDPQAAARPVVASREGDRTGSLELQLAAADSLVRARLSELSALTEQAQDMAEAARARGVAVMGRPPEAAPGPRTVMVLKSRGSEGDLVLQALGDSIAGEVTRRLERSSAWQIVDQPARPIRDGAIPADVFVTVGAVPVGKDSVAVRIAVRNTTPGSSFGYNVLSSQPFPIDSGRSAYLTTMREAFGVLETLRRVDQGQQWDFDLGRTRGVQGPGQREGPAPTRPQPPDLP
ncbi:MAG TPA: serine/threonine-protein kinase [Gemmatimonadales bacterium]|nr:serine/threonine-protein kinase [Gemmatimonadales bacterium]